MNVRSLPSMTIDQFFVWYETQERKYEFVGGTPRMLPCVKRNHTTVAMNLSGILWQSVGSGEYLVGCSDFAVETPNGNLRFPDIVMFGADVPGSALRTSHPTLIVEILSDTTQHLDFGEKKQEYLAIENVREYIVLEQDKPVVWLWARDKDGEWPDDPVILEGNKAILTLDRFGITIPLSAIYAGVN